MKWQSIVALWSVLSATVSCSQSTVYDLTANQYHDNCFFITNLNHSFIDYKDPYISVHAMVRTKTVKDEAANTEREETVDYDMNVILLNEKDIKHTNIENLNINHCTIEMIKEHKCEEEKTGLIDVREDLKYAVANVILASNGANLLVYPVQETGWYCTFIKIHSDADEDVDFPIRFEIQQSFGELTVHGYEELETGIIMYVLYLITVIVYKIYNHRALNKLDLKDYSLLVKVARFQRIQTSLYKYCVFNSVLFLVTVIRYSIINVTTYNHDYLALKLFQFCELTSNTVFAVWIVYHVLLFSDGFNLVNNKKNTLLNIIATRGLTFLLFLSFIIFDLEESSIFSIQSYLSDFFKPFAEKNEFNLSIGEFGGWIIYCILGAIALKVILNAMSTVKLLKYRSPNLIKNFRITIGAILATPIHMFILAPIFTNFEMTTSGGIGSFYSSKRFVFTSLPFGVFLNFLNFVLICYIWRGADLSDENYEPQLDEEFQNSSRGQQLDDEEEVIELNKL